MDQIRILDAFFSRDGLFIAYYQESEYKKWNAQTAYVQLIEKMLNAVWGLIVKEHLCIFSGVHIVYFDLFEIIFFFTV